MSASHSSSRRNFIKRSTLFGAAAIMVPSMNRAWDISRPTIARSLQPLDYAIKDGTLPTSRSSSQISRLWRMSMPTCWPLT